MAQRKGERTARRRSSRLQSKQDDARDDQTIDAESDVEHSRNDNNAQVVPKQSVRQENEPRETQREGTTGQQTNQESKLRALLTTDLLRLARHRSWPKTLCPSEVARTIHLPGPLLAEAKVRSWRDLMPTLRDICVELHNLSDQLAENRADNDGAEDIEILQKGFVLPRPLRVDDIRGPIRVRKRQHSTDEQSGE